MMELYRDLFWLPRPPADFSNRVKQAASSERPKAGLEALAKYGLGLDQATKLGRAAKKAVTAQDPNAFRLGLLGHGTLDYLPEVLVATGLRYGLDVEVTKGDYEQILQNALDPASQINRAKSHAVLLALDARRLDIIATPGDAAAAAAAVERVLSFVHSVCTAIAQNSGAVCIVTTLAPAAETVFGSFERAVIGTQRNIIDEINRRLTALLSGGPHLLFDVAALAETVGLGTWHDHGQWNLAKLPFNADFLPLYAEHVVRILAAMRGKSRRVLVLDLDNTLWGGVIGDDGLAGIVLAQGDAAGEAYLSVQQWALGLRARGIVLAVCSKNTDEVARQVFQQHPDMLLREEHIAVFQANWNDKASNLKAISDKLSLGLSSFVFLDDNPVERGLVRDMLPEVAVPEVGDDPALYPRTLAAAGYFEAITFSVEDSQRADFYQNNAERAALLTTVGDVEAYLASLKMEIIFASFDDQGRARIAQLINKSNQFNLTTHRYTETEVKALTADADVFTLQIRLTDIFGDNGMISVIICRRDDRVWNIDTWLMSCRVLGRGIEKMVLRELISEARKRGIEKLVGLYLPSGRNQMVEDHYAKLGFAPSGNLGEGGTQWSIDVSTEISAVPMSVKQV